MRRFSSFWEFNTIQDQFLFCVVIYCGLTHPPDTDLICMALTQVRNIQQAEHRTNSYARIRCREHNTGYSDLYSTESQSDIFGFKKMPSN